MSNPEPLLNQLILPHVHYENKQMCPIALRGNCSCIEFAFR